MASAGAAALVVPPRVLALVDVSVTRAAGRNTVRAVYGGFGGAVSFRLLVGTRAPRLRPGICVTLATAVAGMALGRLVSSQPAPGRSHPGHWPHPHAL